MKKPQIAFFIVLITVAGMSLLIGSIQQNLGQPGVLVGDGLIKGLESEVLRTNCVILPENVGIFKGFDQPVSEKVTEWLPPDTTFGFKNYIDDDTDFQALTQVVLMGRDRTSIHKPEYCLYGAGFKIEKIEKKTIQMQSPEPYSLPVTRIHVTLNQKQTDGTTKRSSGYYYYWFISEDQITASHKERIMLMVRDLLKSRVLKRWAYVSFLAVAQPGVEEALDAKMIELIQQSVPQFQLTPPPERLKIPSPHNN